MKTIFIIFVSFLIGGAIWLIVRAILNGRALSLSESDFNPEKGRVYFYETMTPVGEFPVEGCIISSSKIIVDDIFTDEKGIKYVKFSWYVYDPTEFEMDDDGNYKHKPRQQYEPQFQKYDDFIRVAYISKPRTVII